MKCFVLIWSNSQVWQFPGKYWEIMGNVWEIRLLSIIIHIIEFVLMWNSKHSNLPVTKFLKAPIQDMLHHLLSVGSRQYIHGWKPYHTEYSSLRCTNKLFLLLKPYDLTSYVAFKSVQFFPFLIFVLIFSLLEVICPIHIIPYKSTYTCEQADTGCISYSYRTCYHQ